MRQTVHSSPVKPSSAQDGDAGDDVDISDCDDSESQQSVTSDSDFDALEDNEERQISISESTTTPNSNKRKLSNVFTQANKRPKTDVSNEPPSDDEPVFRAASISRLKNKLDIVDIEEQTPPNSRFGGSGSGDQQLFESQEDFLKAKLDHQTRIANTVRNNPAILTWCELHNEVIELKRQLKAKELELRSLAPYVKEFVQLFPAMKVSSQAKTKVIAELDLSVLNSQELQRIGGNGHVRVSKFIKDAPIGVNDMLVMISRGLTSDLRMSAEDASDLMTKWGNSLQMMKTKLVITRMSRDYSEKRAEKRSAGHAAIGGLLEKKLVKRNGRFVHIAVAKGDKSDNGKNPTLKKLQFNSLAKLGGGSGEIDQSSPSGPPSNGIGEILPPLRLHPSNVSNDEKRMTFPTGTLDVQINNSDGEKNKDHKYTKSMTDTSVSDSNSGVDIFAQAVVNAKQSLVSLSSANPAVLTTSPYLSQHQPSTHQSSHPTPSHQPSHQQSSTHTNQAVSHLQSPQLVSPQLSPQLQPPHSPLQFTSDSNLSMLQSLPVPKSEAQMPSPLLRPPSEAQSQTPQSQTPPQTPPHPQPHMPFNPLSEMGASSKQTNKK